MGSRFLVLFAFVFLSHTSFAQYTLYGKVVDSKNEPLWGAAVYLDNTSIGTSTLENGEFELLVPEGVFTLVVSYLGYDSAQYSLHSNNPQKKLTFKLTRKVNVLNEVVISNKNKMSKEDRAYFLNQFKRNFLGTSNLSKECVLLNEDVLDFDFDLETKTLEVSASEPLQIKNNGLGYLLTYDLVHYKNTTNRISYLGYSRYENLKGSKRKIKKWERKRRVAYLGSTQHFLRSLIDNNLKDQGYIVHQFKKVKNPERPHDSSISKARKELRKLIKFHGNELIQIGSNNSISLQLSNAKKKINTEKTELKNNITKTKDSLLAIVSKSRLKKYLNQQIKNNLTAEEIIKLKNKVNYLSFDHYLTIKYMKESEEDNYRPGPNKLNYQSSIISLFVDKTPFGNDGILYNPLDVFLEGYWSYEKMASSLPTNYKPKE